MEDIYQAIEEKSSQGYVPKEKFDSEKWAAEKQEVRESVYAMIDDTALEVNNDPEKLNGYLDVMARFPNRTATAALQIFAQRPDATRIFDTEGIDKAKGRIKKGESGFYLLVPAKDYYREDESIGTLFDAKKHFDISQTTIKPILPARYQEADVVKAMARSAEPRIAVADDLQGEFAIYDMPANTIQVQRDMTPTQLFWGLATELAHAQFARGDANYDREANSSRAELAATVLAKRYGIEIPFGDAPAPAAPSAEPKEIRDVLSGIKDATSSISADMRPELSKPKERSQEMAR